MNPLGEGFGRVARVFREYIAAAAAWDAPDPVRNVEYADPIAR